ncbi:MAG: helix-turn-helix transcriptional regulator [Flavobacteriales bacterium Tduv]
MISRIEKIISDYGLSHAAFSDKIGVTRSSLSHIFSGRNKPSLEVVLKIYSAFPNLDLEWLLTGKKSFSEGSKSSNSSSHHPILPIEKGGEESQAVERIVIFFKNRTFKSYTPHVKDK